MKKFLPLSALLLISCSDFSADLKGEAVLDYGNSTGTILTCTDKLDGKVVKPADGSEYRLCKDGQWFAVDIGDFDEADVIKPTAKSSSSEKEDSAKSSSSQKSEASKQSSSSKKVIVFDEDDDDELLPSKQSSSSDKTAPSSSSATNVPASSAIVTPPEKIEISSSSKDKPTSSWSSEAAIGSSSSSVAIAASSSSKVVIFEPDDPIVSPIVSSSSVAPKSSSSTVAKSSSSITKPVSSSSEKIVEPEPESSSEDTVESSSSKDPVENLYICEDGETIVENIDNCPENQEPESSSSEEEIVEPEPESSSETVVINVAKPMASGTYDCEEYKCITTEYLNQELLESGKYGEILDERDGQVYKTIQIGEQVWLAQNLNYVTDGGNADDRIESWCYGDNPGNCAKYGRLYLWTASMNVPEDLCGHGHLCGSMISSDENGYIQGLCPTGWHVPNVEEAETLLNYANGGTVAGKYLKATSDWSRYVGNNFYGFSALPAGGYDKDGLGFWYRLDAGNFLLALEADENTSYRLDLNHDEDNAWIRTNASKKFARSLRCIYNEPAEEIPTQSSSSEETESSSSEETTEPEPESSSEAIVTNVAKPMPSGTYDCETYSCFTTKYLNQNLLNEGIYQEILDERDGQVYKTIQFKTQIWMAQNLNYKSDSSVCYRNQEQNCAFAGELYPWNDIESKKTCPAGWHVPSKEDWDTLLSVAATSMEENVNGIFYNNIAKTFLSGEKDNGFSAVYGGRFESINDIFYDINSTERLWSSSLSGDNAYNIDFYVRYDYIRLSLDNKNHHSFALRCIYNESAEEISIQSSSSKEAESSSSEKNVELEPESSSAAVDPLAKYDCSEYNCVTTEYLNQEMLAAGKYGEFLDERDNQVYRTIKIGEQTWMAQNLNYEVENSGCTEGDDCSKVGRLYDWAQVMEFSSTYNNATASSLIKTPHRGICPTNYHVPTNSEWQTLHNYVANQSGVTSVTTELNAHTGWATTGYSDSFGFSMIPMGAVKSGNGRAAFWTSTELSSIRSNRWFKDYTNNPYSGYTFSNTISDPKTSTMLLRCLKD